MIVVGLFLLGLALIGVVSSALDPDESKDSCTLDVLLFLLCLVGVLHAHQKRAQAEDCRCPTVAE